MSLISAFFGVTDVDPNFKFSSWTRSRHPAAPYEIVPPRAQCQLPVKRSTQGALSCTSRTQPDILHSQSVEATSRHSQPLPFRPWLLANAADCRRLSAFTRQCPFSVRSTVI
ncbi:hypothetical protein FA13DRAFT_1735229 [Coprinellus micaceus]|uniref:Uncharacterized protein n=1 Tax=Coprinellus micaceus TaxID=71717 RepID=A0A4Y7T4K7_COPMI|nr:hypothetical protein FA13DRAFT_1735229 [Coprinellus micaceus]